MIVRTWRGWTLSESARGYEDYMHRVALDGYAKVEGNQGVLMLKRDAGGDRTEFVMVTLWRDMDSVQAFAGPEPSKAVFYPEDDEFLVDRDWEVAHFEVYGRTPALGAEEPPSE